PCKAVNARDVDLMFVELIQRCRQLFLAEADAAEDHVYQLPSFLQSVASVLLHLDAVPEVHSPVLEHLVVMQMDSFPQYSPKMQLVCCRAIVRVFLALAEKGPILWSCIGAVVHQSLIRICSKPVILQKDSLLADEAFVFVNFSLQSLNRLLYDEFVKSVLKIVEKLDLTLEKQNVGEQEDENKAAGIWVIPTSDPTANLHPVKPKDFSAFVNLVEFCREILPEKHVEFFGPWVHSFSYQLILQSTRLPLISGFYKLLSLAVRNAKKIKYFEGVGPKSQKPSPEDPEKHSCFALFAKFGKEVSVKMKQYKDELLASCLTFVLSLPHDIIALDVRAYVPALQVGLSLVGVVVPEKSGSLGCTHMSEPPSPPPASIPRAASPEARARGCVAWDRERRLSFAVPFVDMKPVVHLDLFLPRVTELALSAGDRHTKVAACELLHSVVMFMLGKATQMPDGGQGPPPMYQLYKRTFPVLLRLACDVDQDGIVDPVDSTLRDFCGQCIREFLKWSIKQTTPQQQENSPVNTKSLFKRLYSFALHPNAFKRLGASLAFNNIYREFSLYFQCQIGVCEEDMGPVEP
ncbi:PRKDC, partial [Cervus elaphus hippelaphus]